MNTRFAISPPDEDRYENNPEHEQEEIRRQAFDCFVASLRDYAFHDGWAEVLTAVTEAFDGFVGTPITTQIREFSVDYGWPSTLRAIAQAMDADEQFKKEAEGRR